MKVIEKKSCEDYLKKRNLLEQYKKAKKLLSAGVFTGLDLKKRKPKSEGTWSFRINKKYRAWGYFEGEVLKIFKIDDHQ